MITRCTVHPVSEHNVTEMTCNMTFMENSRAVCSNNEKMGDALIFNGINFLVALKFLHSQHIDVINHTALTVMYLQFD